MQIWIITLFIKHTDPLPCGYWNLRLNTNGEQFKSANILIQQCLRSVGPPNMESGDSITSCVEQSLVDAIASWAICWDFKCEPRWAITCWYILDLYNFSSRGLKHKDKAEVFPFRFIHASKYEHLALEWLHYRKVSSLSLSLGVQHASGLIVWWHWRNH